MPGIIESPQNKVRQIAAYIKDARGKVSTPSAREAAIRCIFDLVGTMTAGINSRLACAIRRTAPKIMGNGNVPMWFSGQCSTAIGAAWANCAAASALDLDDGNRIARGHPGAAVIPTAFAVGHETNASFEEIITAIVIGYEVGVTIASARTNLGHTGTWAPYAVVATAAALRGTSGESLENALAIAGDSAPNQVVACVPGQTRSDIKEGIPWAVVTGMTALELAEAGHTGSRDILDCAIHYHFPKDLQLGLSPLICNTYFKLYACCRYIHAPVDALLEVIAQHDVAVSSIESIDVETHRWSLHISNQVYPSDLVQVLYSIPYCMALAALRGSSSLLPVTPEALVNGTKVSELAAKVKITVDPELDKAYPAETLARVKILCEGREFASRVTAPLGEATNPLTWEDLEKKLTTATRLVTTEIEQKRILKAIDQFKSGDMKELTGVLAGLNLVEAVGNQQQNSI